MAVQPHPPAWSVTTSEAEFSAMSRQGNPLGPEATVELLNRVKGGDDAALERLLERCIPALRRWARGRLPTSARGMLVDRFGVPWMVNCEQPS